MFRNLEWYEAGRINWLKGKQGRTGIVKQTSIRYQGEIIAHYEAPCCIQLTLETQKQR